MAATVMTGIHLRRPIVAAIFWLVCGSGFLMAHHSFSAAFDGSRKISLLGVVTKLEWENPHSYLYVDVRGDHGMTVTWICQAAGPNSLIHLGWNRNSVKIG